MTEQQLQTLDFSESEPPQVIDPRTDAAYVLIPLGEYAEVREIVDDEKRQRDFRSVALRNAGRRLLEEHIAQRKQLGILDLFGTIDYYPDYDYKERRKR